MRHTLLPKAAKDALHHEYHERAVSVALFAAAAAIVVGAVALLPSLSSSWSVSKSAAEALAAEDKGQSMVAISSANSQLSADARLASALSAASGEPPLSDAVASITAVRGPISVSSLALGRISTSTISAVISGISPTRDDLVAFQSRLENIAPGAKADLPISELAKSSDIQFSISLVMDMPSSKQQP